MGSKEKGTKKCGAILTKKQKITTARARERTREDDRARAAAHTRKKKRFPTSPPSKTPIGPPSTPKPDNPRVIEVHENACCARGQLMHDQGFGTTHVETGEEVRERER